MLWILAAELLYMVLAWREWTNGWLQVCLFLALFACQFAILYLAPRPTSLRTIVWSAILFRITLLPAGYHGGEWQRFLLYDSDIWRYLWDGHVSAQGVNPYRYAPGDDKLEEFARDPHWSTIRDQINYREIRTIYPPFAQLLFLAAPGSVLGMKITVVIFDLLTLLFVILTLQSLGRPPTDCIWWAWNPLVIKVFAGSGHVDSLTCAALAALFYFVSKKSREIPAIAAFTIAVLSKWSPLALLPLLARRLRLLPLAAAATGIAAISFAIPDLFTGARSFAESWEFNGLQIPRLISAAGIVAVCVGSYFLPRTEGDLESFYRRTGYTLGALILLSPAVMPWYVTWLLPGAILAKDRAWIAFSGIVFLAFFVMVDGQERWYIVAVEYLALFSVLTWRFGKQHHEEHMDLHLLQ